MHFIVEWNFDTCMYLSLPVLPYGKLPQPWNRLNTIPPRCNLTHVFVSNVWSSCIIIVATDGRFVGSTLRAGLALVARLSHAIVHLSHVFQVVYGHNDTYTVQWKCLTKSSILPESLYFRSSSDVLLWFCNFYRKMHGKVHVASISALF